MEYRDRLQLIGALLVIACIVVYSIVYNSAIMVECNIDVRC